jgi:hypothetical protein
VGEHQPGRHEALSQTPVPPKKIIKVQITLILVPLTTVNILVHYLCTFLTCISLMFFHILLGKIAENKFF